nr:hypothetical protein [Tanacetum cinerariifolium]
MVKFMSNVMSWNALKVMLSNGNIKCTAKLASPIDNRHENQLTHNPTSVQVTSFVARVYYSDHEKQLTHRRRVLDECIETNGTEPVSIYHSLRAKDPESGSVCLEGRRANVDGLPNVVVTNVDTIRQFAMKVQQLIPDAIYPDRLCNMFLDRLLGYDDFPLNCSHVKVMLVAIDIAIYKSQTTPPMRNKGYFCRKLTQACDPAKPYYAGLNFTSPAFHVLNLWVGTVGRVTQLASQSTCLNPLGIKGACIKSPSSNGQLLARIVVGLDVRW